MGKIIYVNGGIVIKTPYFKSTNIGALFPEPPEGSETWEPNEEENGYRFLEISDERPQSIFNSYYAKCGFATYELGAVLLHKDFSEAHRDYIQIVNDISELLEVVSNSGLNEKYIKIIRGQAIVNVIASVETFICDTILTKITEDENIFHDFHKFLFDPFRKEAKEFLNQGMIGEYEQKVIDGVIELSYSNIKRIDKIYREIFDIAINDINDTMHKHISNRHKFAHKNGRGKDGTYIDISKEEISDLISDANAFVDQIMSKINI
ncbi:HEPN domain-containing protein [Proteiniphilum sp.]|uniref:HEPN domain-containing protein n=1 Tax=Proteiniphilum sp. TaxID=1926877 RepID=UPI002B218B28|nr:HEPN domain-containing protein [Proteiniphilum sp.]MEA4919234.1 HEPN domain-containing protein [Proteiniphilum sp.]